VSEAIIVGSLVYISGLLTLIYFRLGEK